MGEREPGSFNSSDPVHFVGCALAILFLVGAVVVMLVSSS